MCTARRLERARWSDQRNSELTLSLVRLRDEEERGEEEAACEADRSARAGGALQLLARRALPLARCSCTLATSLGPPCRPPSSSTPATAPHFALAPTSSSHLDAPSSLRLCALRVMVTLEQLRTSTRGGWFAAPARCACCRRSQSPAPPRTIPRTILLRPFQLPIIRPSVGGVRQMSACRCRAVKGARRRRELVPSLESSSNGLRFASTSSCLCERSLVGLSPY